MAPYGFGMYAAYLHLQGTKYLDSKFNYLIVLEWICFIHVLLNPLVNFVDSPVSGPSYAWLMTLLAVFQRSLYGASLSFLLVLMLSVPPDEIIPWYRPSKVLRAFLSWSLFLPIATLSFSFYLMHL